MPRVRSSKNKNPTTNLSSEQDRLDWVAVEERIRRLLFEKPEEFWNLPKLQEVYKTN